MCFASCGAEANGGGSIGSEQAEAVSEALGAGAAVLFVVGNTTLSAGDTAIKTRLQGLGATVTVRGAPAATSADAQGKALIVISESVTSADVNTKFRDSAVPVICLEPALFDDFKLAGTVQDTDYGSVANQTELELTAVSQPLAAGLTVPISSTAGTFSWARPAPGAISIAKIVGTSDHMGIFAFDAGQALTSGVAPARRVGWVASANLPTTLTKQGWQLFDDAVNWSTNATCTKTPLATACSGNSCGTASDGCGGTYACGSCASSAPICVSNTCKQCAAAADCPSGSFNCTNNACVCRAPSSGNVIKDGGFDTPTTLNGWTSTQTTWSNGDADSCPESGSVTTTGSITRCIQIPTAPAGGQLYALGMRYKASSGTGGCLGLFYQDARCTQPTGPDFLNLGAGQSSSWASTITFSTVPELTSSILLQCNGNGSLTIEQIFLRVSGFAGSGF